MYLNLPSAKYATPATRRAFCDQLIAGIDRIPGVRNATVSSEIALHGGDNGYVSVPGNTQCIARFAAMQRFRRTSF
jgi:hypothetical protein